MRKFKIITMGFLGLLTLAGSLFWGCVKCGCPPPDPGLSMSFVILDKGGNTLLNNNRDSNTVSAWRFINNQKVSLPINLASTPQANFAVTMTMPFSTRDTSITMNTNYIQINAGKIDTISMIFTSYMPSGLKFNGIIQPWSTTDSNYINNYKNFKIENVVYDNYSIYKFKRTK